MSVEEHQVIVSKLEDKLDAQQAHIRKLNAVLKTIRYIAVRNGNNDTVVELADSILE